MSFSIIIMFVLNLHSVNKLIFFCKKKKNFFLMHFNNFQLNIIVFFILFIFPIKIEKYFN